MKAKTVFRIALLAVGVEFLAIAYSFGKMAGRDQAREQQCGCGETSPCAFGPGIVGLRRCKPWSRERDVREPDPRYRVTTEGK